MYKVGNYREVYVSVRRRASSLPTLAGWGIWTIQYSTYVYILLYRTRGRFVPSQLGQLAPIQQQVGGYIEYHTHGTQVGGSPVTAKVRAPTGGGKGERWHQGGRRAAREPYMYGTWRRLPSGKEDAPPCRVGSRVEVEQSTGSRLEYCMQVYTHMYQGTGVSE